MTEHRIEEDTPLVAQLLLTMSQAARVLHVGRTTVYGLVNDGALRTVHIGRSCRITRSELERYVARLDRDAMRPVPGSTRTRPSRAEVLPLRSSPGRVLPHVGRRAHDQTDHIRKGFRP